ncbi:MAG: hypothetical protein J5736_04120, partial [Bacilli bacterium]|nr:hypothetical protein [Bacilli bacterium]
IIDAIFPALSLEPTMDLGGLLCGAGAAFLVLNSIFLILGSKHKLASLRIFLLFVFLIVGFLGASLVLAIFVPDLAFFKDFFQPIFPDNTIMWAILFCLAALLSFIGLWISFSAAHSRKKRVRKNRDLYEMEANGFDYERDGDEISVTKKAGTYIVDMDDFQKLCSMVQKMFNNGYCRILHIDMKNYHFLFK